ncbi:MAG: putative oxidoreductase [Cypionkella sp.]|nr:putative oxidoreductase [Cypionkella sp.]
MLPQALHMGARKSHRELGRPRNPWTFCSPRLIAAFYILCADNEVDRSTDEKRIRWAAGDIADKRPPLLGWHPHLCITLQGMVAEMIELPCLKD